MADGVLSAADLRTLLGTKRDADTVRHLERQGIACFDGPDGPWTTLELIKVAGMVKMGLITPDSNPAPEKEKKKWLQ